MIGVVALAVTAARTGTDDRPVAARGVGIADKPSLPLEFAVLSPASGTHVSSCGVHFTGIAPKGSTVSFLPSESTPASGLAPLDVQVGGFGESTIDLSLRPTRN
jgi:hypothetical protein